MIDKVARSLRKRASRLLGAPVRAEDLLRRKVIARAYLRGSGLEIGALHNPLKVPPAAQVRYVDKRGWVLWQKGYPEVEGLANVLNSYGAQGWELVGLAPERTEPPGEGPGQVSAYRATFKRPKQGGE